MLFEITHITEFSYSQPVFLEPVIVRLRPRCDGSQALMFFEMHVEPPPGGITNCIDLDGNSIVRMWFNGTQKELSITTKSKVETLRTDPFDFILEPTALTLPMIYAEEAASPPAPYRDRAAIDDEVAHLAESIAGEVDNQTLPFLSLLTQRIHEMSERIVRIEGEPWPASVTLRRHQGACRDQAVLFMDACRTLGLATRFVSGYGEGDRTQSKLELHAWVEVYLPGAGWRGYDPMRGTAVSDGHVALAAGPTSLAAAPTSGTFRGTSATSTLRTHIQMSVTNAEPYSPDITAGPTGHALHPP